MNRHLAHALRRTAQALRLVADVLDPIERATYVSVELDGRKVAEAVHRNGGDPAPARR